MPNPKYISEDGKIRCGRGDLCIHPNGPWLPATLEYFGPKKSGPTGLKSYCRVCKNELERQRYAQNIDAEHERWRKRYERDAEKESERKARYRAEHPERVHEIANRWSATHKEQRKEASRRYHLEHRIEDRVKVNRYHARKRGLPNSFTADEMIAALNYWHWSCAYCDQSLAQLSFLDELCLHFDHFIPLIDHRPDNPGTVASNMLPTCAGCNRGKHDADPLEWLVHKFGKRKAKQILTRIKEYKTWLSR